MREHAKQVLKRLAVCSLLAVTGTGSAFASPIPTFDKEDVTTHPYNHTGEQSVSVDKTALGEGFRPGNTGTEAAPALYIKDITIDGEPLKDSDGEFAALLRTYTGRSVQTSELPALADAITAAYQKGGYTVAQAVIPPQEVKNGVLTVKVYTARYDAITIQNTSDVADSLFEKYAYQLKSGDYIKTKKLEDALNIMNDLPAVTARAVLAPGSVPGTTSLAIEATRRPVWNNYVFVDNGGGYYSGRWRTGFQTEIDNLGHTGDRFLLSGMITNHQTKNYGIRYDVPVGWNGTRWGIAYSKSSYEIHSNNFYTSLGESRGYSFYGLTPLYRDKTDRLTAIYGYDRRKIRDRIRFDALGNQIPEIHTNKDANVWHVGLSGSQYNINNFIQYDLIYWYGDIDTRNEDAYYDGAYHKLTGDLLNIYYRGLWNYRLKFSGQLANRALDGSEQFYLGGMNGVRAYGASDGYGDYGFLTTFEIRRKANDKGLEYALFLDHGVAGLHGGTLDHLTGAGIGLRYEKPNDWYAQIDYAWKIGGREDRTEPGDRDGRFWIQVYKMF